MRMAQGTLSTIADNLWRDLSLPIEDRAVVLQLAEKMLEFVRELDELSLDAVDPTGVSAMSVDS